MTELTLKAELGELDVTPPSKELELATLTYYDIPALAALAVEAYGRAPSAESLWEATDEMRMYFDGAFGQVRDDSFLGAWLDGELVGAIFCVLDAPYEGVPRGPFVLDLIVDPTVRRQGLATALIAALAKRVDQWDYDSLSLQLDMGLMPEAFQLYQRLGFTEHVEDLANNV